MPSRRAIRPPFRPALPIAAALLGFAAPALAEPAAHVPVPPPLPPERPTGLAPPPESVPTPPARPADIVPGAQDRTPKAEDRPEGTGEAGIPTPPPTPPERPAELSGAAALALTVAPPDDTACRVRLKRLGAAFEPLPPISEGQCSAPLPLRVAGLADGVGLPQGATLTCRMAEALARWTTEVQVEAERTLHARLTGLETGGSYVCRGQNHDLDAKLSEHAFADAIDVSGFTLAGRAAVPVEAMPPGTPEADFLAAVRAKACAVFRTVLGPGTNAAHATHFHFDDRERPAGHRLCE